MKKLILKANAFNKGEVLTRAQLKKVSGGVKTKGDCLASLWNFPSSGNADADAIMAEVMVDACNKYPNSRPQ